MTKPCISIVIPAHNARAYLKECIDSVLCQPEVGEVIIVDDGSTDDTLELAAERAHSDSRIRVISQQNCGVSIARNAGLEIASLPWLAFVDSDDIVPPHSFSSLLNAAQENNADIVYGDYAVWHDQTTEPCAKEFEAFSPGIVKAHDVLVSLTSVSSNSVSGSCCRILFRASFLERIQQRFPATIAMSEDYCFMVGCLSHNPIVAYINEVVYFVRREGGSATQTYMHNIEQSMDYVNGELRKACECDSLLMRNWWECVANTAWEICNNLYKENSPLNPADRRIEIRRVLSKYHEAIKRISMHGNMDFPKALVLKAGCICPWLLWIIQESRSVKTKKCSKS